jgi:hypothetical protein
LREGEREKAKKWSRREDMEEKEYSVLVIYLMMLSVTQIV